MISNLIDDHGGFYSRVTRQIRLLPFTLGEHMAVDVREEHRDGEYGAFYDKARNWVSGGGLRRLAKGAPAAKERMHMKVTGTYLLVVAALGCSFSNAVFSSAVGFGFDLTGGYTISLVVFLAFLVGSAVLAQWCYRNVKK